MKFFLKSLKISSKCNPCVKVTFNVPENVKWIKVNSRQSGYYRVLYNDDNWANIIEDLSNNPNKFTSEVSSYISAYLDQGKFIYINFRIVWVYFRMLLLCAIRICCHVRSQWIWYNICQVKRIGAQWLCHWDTWRNGDASWNTPNASSCSPNSLKWNCRRWSRRLAGTMMAMKPQGKIQKANKTKSK